MTEHQKKYTLRLSPEMEQAVAKLSKESGMTTADVFRKAIGTEVYLSEELKRGNRILVEHKETGRVRELVFR